MIHTTEKGVSWIMVRTDFNEIMMDIPARNSSSAGYYVARLSGFAIGSM